MLTPTQQDRLNNEVIDVAQFNAYDDVSNKVITVSIQKIGNVWEISTDKFKHMDYGTKTRQSSMNWISQKHSHMKTFRWLSNEME